MKLELRYFASLRESLGVEREQVQLPDEVDDLQTLRAWLTARGDAWSQQFDPRRRLMMSVNQVMARQDDRLQDGDEVAFFPPVTGG